MSDIADAAHDSTASGNEAQAPAAPQSAPDSAPLLSEDAPGAGADAPPKDGQPASKDGKPAQQPGTDAAAPARELTPESYDTALPEGFMGNEPLLKEFKGFMAEAKVPPEIARKVLDLQVKNEQGRIDAFLSMQAEWKQELLADKEFGGANIETTVRDAKKALAAYDPSGKLLSELTSGGYGNHPGITRFLARVGRTLKEDTAHSGREGTTDTRPLRDRLWPD